MELDPVGATRRAIAAQSVVAAEETPDSDDVQALRRAARRLRQIQRIGDRRPIPASRMRQALEELACELDALADRNGAATADQRAARVKRAQRLLDLRTPRAAGLLLHLAARPGELCAYRDIEAAIGSDGPVIKVYVSYVRAALAARGFPDALRNVNGVGYCLAAEAAAAVHATLRAPDLGTGLS